MWDDLVYLLEESIFRKLINQHRIVDQLNTPVDHCLGVQTRQGNDILER